MMERLKNLLARIGTIILLGIAGGLTLAFIAMLLAVGVVIVQNASTVAEIPLVVTQLEQNANMSLDLLQELLEDIPLGRQIGYLFDGFLQKQLINPFTLAGGQDIWVRSLITAAFVNLFSLILAPQRAISSIAHADAFQYVASVMQLVCNALAIIALTLLERVFVHAIAIGIGLALLAFLLETAILYWRIKLFRFSRILLYVVKHDIIGFLLKQTVFALFLCTLIHILGSDYSIEMWEYVLCMTFLVVTVPIIDWVEHIFK